MGKPVKFFSKTLNASQKLYLPVEKEETNVCTFNNIKPKNWFIIFLSEANEFEPVSTSSPRVVNVKFCEWNGYFNSKST